MYCSICELGIGLYSFNYYEPYELRKELCEFIELIYDSRLENLEILMISGNHIAAIPSEFSNLKKLRELVLDANELETLPEALAECDNLNVISIIENPMEGGIPRVLLDKKGLSIDQ